MTKEDRLKGICYEINRELNQGKIVELHYNYGEIVTITYKGKRVCSRSGSGYEKLGAAFGDIVTYINPEALLAVYNTGAYQDCVYMYEYKLKVDGAVSLNYMIHLMKDMGYLVDYTSKTLRSGNNSGKIIIKKIKRGV